MGRPDPEQSPSSHGQAAGNNAPYDWSGLMYIDCHNSPQGIPPPGCWWYAGGDQHEYLALFRQVMHHI